MILLQNIGYAHAEWAFRDADGQWSAQGNLAFPWGAEYEKPEPVRLCYPNVMLKDRAVYFCGVSDIVEPNLQWRAYKKELTGQNWDYDFRRLFFTWTEDITRAKFHDWIEIASREKTCGWIFPCDLWVAADGVVHLLWSERALDARLREKFFPDAKQSQALNYAQIRAGQVVGRRTLILAEEGAANLVAGAARFHVTPDQRLWVICYVSGTEADGKSVSENRLFELSADGAARSPSASRSVSLSRPSSPPPSAAVRRPPTSWICWASAPAAGTRSAMREFDCRRQRPRGQHRPRKLTDEAVGAIGQYFGGHAECRRGDHRGPKRRLVDGLGRPWYHCTRKRPVNLN